MKCNVKFYVSRKVFYEPKDLKVYSFFSKGEDIDECINNASDRLDSLVGFNVNSNIQEICVKVV